MQEALMTEELRAFQETLRRWIEDEVTPHHEKWEKEGITPAELYQKAGKQGFLCPTIPEEYGGLGLDFRYSALVTEELSRAMASGVAFFLHSDVIVPYVEHYGSEAQKKKWLPKLVSGELISAIAMTEPGTGSDLQGIKTKALLEKNEWVLNGAKTFISNGHISNFLILVAETPTDKPTPYKSLSLFVVEGNPPGYTRGRKLEKLGLKAQDTAELSFENCRIPKENLLGEAGKGFLYLTNELAQERLTVAIWSTALAERCLELTTEYVKERKAFGKRIGDFQNTRFKIAEIATEVQVGRSLVDECIREHMSEAGLSAVKASMAKYWCSESLGRVADECLQLFGGYGYMTEYPISKAYADARVQRIYAGTTEIMKEIISRKVLGS